MVEDHEEVTELEALEVEDGEVEETAAANPGEGGGGRESTIDQVAYQTQLLDEDWETRKRAARSLAELGTEGQPMVSWLLILAGADADTDVQTAAGEAIEVIDTAVYKQLHRLSDDNWEERVKAVQALGEGAKSNAVYALMVMLAYVVDGDEDVRKAAIETVTPIAATAVSIFTQALEPLTAVILSPEKLADQNRWEIRFRTVEIAGLGERQPEIADRISRVAQNDIDYDVRELAVSTLGKWHGDDGAYTMIISRLAIVDPHEKVRRTALKIARQMVPDEAVLAKAYLDMAPKMLSEEESPDVEVRQRMIDALHDLGPAAQSTAGLLVRTSVVDCEPNVRAAARRAVIKVVADEGQLSNQYDLLAQTILDEDKQADYDVETRQRMVQLLAEGGLAGEATIRLLWETAVEAQDEDETDIRQAALDALLVVCADPARLAQELATQFKDAEPDKYVPLALVLHRLEQPEVNRSVIQFIWQTAVKQHASEHLAQLFDAGLTLSTPDFLQNVIERRQSLERDQLGLLGGMLVDDHREAFTAVWRQASQQDQEMLLPLILAALDDEDWTVRRNAVLWLGSNENNIQKYSEAKHVAIYQDLKQRMNEDAPHYDHDADVRMSIDMVLLLFERTIETNEQKRLLRQLKQKDTNIDITINNLVAKDNWKALRSLIRHWVEWVVLDEKYVGVAIAEEEMRRTPAAVLPLMERLKHPLQLADMHLTPNLAENDGTLPQDNLKAVIRLFAPPEMLDMLMRLWRHTELAVEEKLRLQAWLALEVGKHEALTAEEKQQLRLVQDPAERSSSNGRHPKVLLSDEQMRQYLNLIMVDVLKQQELMLHRRITSLLATMSHPWYLQDGRDPAQTPPEQIQQRIETIKIELLRHVVSYFSAELRTAADIEIRENMARTLANLADTGTGQTAIDALVFAVVGEERRQNRRQELLSDYYLEPSKKRSEEAAQILEDAVSQAKNTLRTLRRLNQHLFYVGLVVFVVGFGAALISQELSTQVLGALAGVGGLYGVVRHMIKDPLDRIQNAIGNLVQMEAAFTSFMWELNLNQTFIQSRYVANGHLSQDEIQSTVDRVENAMRTTMGLVETFTETSAPRIVTRLHKVSPVAVQANDKGARVTVHGQYLLGDDMDKKETAGTLAFNHIPVNAPVVKWEIDRVIFRLRTEDVQLLAVNGRRPDTILISLFVDGMETNALPLRLIHVNVAGEEAPTAVSPNGRAEGLDVPVATISDDAS